MTIRSALLMIACVGLVGCASLSPSPSPTEASIQLRFMVDEWCPPVAVQLPLTFRIDSAADEDVVAVTMNGTQYHVWWSEGFRGGTTSDPVVRDPTGQIVARDGEVIRDYVLHGYDVCATGDSIYVLLAGPSMSETPAASPVALNVQATIIDQCGSEGGCAYYADLDGPGGQWHAKFAWGRGGGALVIDEGLPATLALGDYTLTLTSYVVSDVIVNNEPPQESLDASCSADFTVAPGQLPIFARGTFQADECSVLVRGPLAALSPA